MALAGPRVTALATTTNTDVPRVKITLEITPSKGTNNIHFKPDGDRFPEGHDSTIKLCTGCKYMAKLTWQPPVTIKSVQVSQEGAQLPLPIDAPAASHEVVSVWCGTWMCSLQPSPKRSRCTINVVADTEEYGEVTLPLQAKVYRPHDTASLHGSRLRNIQYVTVPVSDGGLRVASTAYFAYPV